MLAPRVCVCVCSLYVCWHQSKGLSFASFLTKRSLIRAMSLFSLLPLTSIDVESAHARTWISCIYRNSGLELVLTVNPFVSTSSRHFQTADHDGYFVIERNSTSGIPALTRFKVNRIYRSNFFLFLSLM